MHPVVARGKREDNSKNNHVFTETYLELELRFYVQVFLLSHNWCHQSKEVKKKLCHTNWRCKVKSCTECSFTVETRWVPLFIRQQLFKGNLECLSYQIGHIGLMIRRDEGWSYWAIPSFSLPSFYSSSTAAVSGRKDRVCGTGGILWKLEGMCQTRLVRKWWHRVLNACRISVLNSVRNVFIFWRFPFSGISFFTASKNKMKNL